jgi:hypothetical protein
MAKKSRTPTAGRRRIVRWQRDVQPHDYPAAESYLRLLHPRKQVARIIQRLREASLVEFKAKDIFRASQLSLLGFSNIHVERDREKILTGAALSPLLLVRDQLHGRLVIADGYHRLCAVYGFDEDALIPCRIV